MHAEHTLHVAGGRARAQSGRSSSSAAAAGDERGVHSAAAVDPGQPDDVGRTGRGARRVGQRGDDLHRDDHGGARGQPRRRHARRDQECDSGKWRRDLLDAEHQQPGERLHVGGTLSGTTSVNAVNGVATFSTLSINNAGNGYTLTASASGLTGATSTAFNITAPPPPPAT